MKENLTLTGDDLLFLPNSIWFSIDLAMQIPKLVGLPWRHEEESEITTD